MIGGVGSSPYDMLALREQMEQMRQQNFNSADVDGDDGLNVKEFEAAITNSSTQKASLTGGSEPQEIFARLDVDGDGNLTYEELAKNSEDMLSGKFSSDAMSVMLSTQEKNGEGTSIGGQPLFLNVLQEQEKENEKERAAKSGSQGDMPSDEPEYKKPHNQAA